tara:strand:- start:1789 stop:1992 length:204 start_codon:yes stop_codon:yes gene_type:complete
LSVKFFDLKDYFTTNFTLINNFNWNLSDLNNMIWWEREIYIKLLIDYQDQKKQEQMNNRFDMGGMNL